MAARSNTDDPGLACLQSLVTQEIACAEDLLDVLSREQRCLKERDIEGITDTAAEKARLVSRMEQLGSQRLHMTSDLHDEKNILLEDSMETGGGQTLFSLWRKLRRLLHHCQTQNQINGCAIQSITKHIERTVQILQGVSSAPSVYGADGEALAPTASRYVTRA